MDLKRQSGVRAALILGAIAAAIGVPLIFAAFSPLLAWRGPVYIAACFAGIIALGLLLLQPLLIGGYVPPLRASRTRRAHRWVGALLVIAVLIHIGGLWITSPPDVIDVLLFSSPTPFSDWGAIAMWAVFATALLASLRRRLRLKPHHWKIAHKFLAAVIIIGTVVHAMLIEGTMETISKVVLCALVVIASLAAIFGQSFLSVIRARTKRSL